MHIQRVHGSRFDVITTAAITVLINQELYCDYLDDRLSDRTTDKSTLQQTLWAMLSSLEIAAVTRLLSILHLSMTLPLRWLSGNTHDLAEYDGWSVIHMNLCLDEVHRWLTDLKGDPSKFVDKDFMLGWFKRFRQQLPPFEEYWQRTFDDNQPVIRSRRTHAIVANMYDVQEEAFDPTNETFQECQDILMELVPKVVNGILEELEDKKKVAWKHLSKFGEECKSKYGYSLSWEHSTPEMKETMMRKRANNSITGTEDSHID